MTNTDHVIEVINYIFSQQHGNMSGCTLFFFTYKVNITFILVKDKIYHSCAYKNRMA